MKIRTQADDMVCFCVFHLTDWANKEVMWNSQFYCVIHKQLYYGIKLVEKIYRESGGHSFIVGYGSKFMFIVYKIYLHVCFGGF